MKFLSGFLAALMATGLWSISGLIATSRMSGFERDGILPYGPVPAVASLSYTYEGLDLAFNPNLPLRRASEFSKTEFEQLILTSLNPSVQKDLKPYINSILKLSVEYQIDPFWIISIIMVESNFKLTAVSPKNARGLMQIKPDTAQHLYQLMQKTLTEAQVSKNLYHPDENIEVGVFYLKKLLQNFRMNYRFATVAYNIGPGKLRSRLGSNSLDVNNFSYLVKVNDRYLKLSQNFSRTLKTRPMPYEGTYVFSDQGLKQEEAILSLYSETGSENLAAYNPGM